MNIDERIWPLPNAFNIREGSPFGRSVADIKALKRSVESSKKGVKTAAIRESKKGKSK